MFEMRKGLFSVFSSEHCSLFYCVAMFFYAVNRRGSAASTWASSLACARSRLQPLVVRRGAPSTQRMVIRGDCCRARSVRQQRVCRKSPFESVAISRQRRFLKQHPGVPFQLQLPLYFQTQPTITLHPFRRMPTRLFERHPAIFSADYANPGP
jgi:hypothetical protein